MASIYRARSDKQLPTPSKAQRSALLLIKKARVKHLKEKLAEMEEYIRLGKYSEEFYKRKLVEAYNIFKPIPK